MPATVDDPLAHPAGPLAPARRPRLRVRRAPALDPPFDDEHERPPAGMEMLPLPATRPATVVGAGRRPATARPGAGAAKGRLAGTAVQRDGGCSGSAAARRFVRLCLEVVNGFRPAAHLRPLMAPQRCGPIIDQLMRHTARLRRSSGGTQPVRLRRVRLCEPSPHAVEAAVVFGHGSRCWSMALRLERGPDGWQCVTAQVI